MVPPKSELGCCGCACCVIDPNSDGVAVGWLCCVLVFPNKDGAAAGCCVDAPLLHVSLYPPKWVVEPTTATALLAGRLQKVPQKVLLLRLAVVVRWPPMRLQTNHRLLAPRIVRSKSQKGHRSRARVSQACSCCRIGLPVLAAMVQADSVRQIDFLMAQAVLLSTQRGRRCLRVVKCLWQKHCLRCTQVSNL